MPPANSISAASRPAAAESSARIPSCPSGERGSACSSAAPTMNAAMRPRIVSQAASTAIPFRSVPDDAAVADVFGTLPVSVAVIRTASTFSPKAPAATCDTLRNRP